MKRILTLLSVTLAIGLAAGSLPARAASNILWANVSADGTLVRGDGAASAKRNSKGTYVVSFNAVVTKCSYSLTTAQYSATLIRPLSGDNTALLIGIIDTRGEDFLDSTFYLQVFCKK